MAPPVNNHCLYSSTDFTIMSVGGPNARTDYHINPTEEFFYQYKGHMILKINKDGVFRDVVINEGDMFLLQKNIPHNPVRFADTVGIVIERTRPLDMLRWYCEECKEILHQEDFYCTNLGTQLKPLIESFAATPALFTCKHCNHYNAPK